jgi:hypothetical protein
MEGSASKIRYTAAHHRIGVYSRAARIVHLARADGAACGRGDATGRLFLGSLRVSSACGHQCVAIHEFGSCAAEEKSFVPVAATV